MKCVYCIKNRKNNKCYIGSTNDYRLRMIAHKSGLYESGEYTYVGLAKTFDVNWSTVAGVITRQSWKHV